MDWSSRISNVLSGSVLATMKVETKENDMVASLKRKYYLFFHRAGCRMRFGSQICLWFDMLWSGKRKFNDTTACLNASQGVIWSSASWSHVEMGKNSSSFAVSSSHGFLDQLLQKISLHACSTSTTTTRRMMIFMPIPFCAARAFSGLIPLLAVLIFIVLSLCSDSRCHDSIQSASFEDQPWLHELNLLFWLVLGRELKSGSI